MTIAFWEVRDAHDVVFHGPLPAGTEIPNNEGLWAEPRMVRVTRFPVDYSSPREAWRAICRAQTLEPGLHLLVAWFPDQWNSHEPRVGYALFRGPSNELLRYGGIPAPDWFQEQDEADRVARPTAWSRLLGSDEL